MSMFSIGSLLLGKIYENKAQKKAMKKAKRDEAAADKQARKAEVFAETEGEGLGQLGQISLEVDDDLEEDEDDDSVLSI